MANNPNSAPDEPTRQGIESMVVRNLIDKHNQDPTYFRKLAVELWKSLTPEQQDLRRLLIADLYPQDELETVEHVAQMLLVAEHTGLEADVAYTFMKEVSKEIGELSETPHPLDRGDENLAA
jgi:hypothetical protein